MGRRRVGSALAVFALALAGACSGDGERATGGSAATTASTTAFTTTTELTPSTATTTTSITTGPQAATASGGCPAAPPPSPPDPNRPRYRLTVHVSPPAQRTVNGTVEVAFTPDLDTDHLVFRLWPNGPRQAAIGARLDTANVTLDGQPVPTILESPTLLAVRPGRTLTSGQTVTVRMEWSLRLPGAVRDRIAAGEDAVRLGSFFPILSWVPGVGWATEPPTTQFAESSTSPSADFEMVVIPPDGYNVIASGRPEGTNRWTATAMRDVAVAVGRFSVSRAVAHAPNPVEVTVGVHAGTGERGDVYLNKSVRALEDFSRRFGPYPWSTFSVSITPTLRSGIEYPAHVMHGPGTSGRQLSHEVGHQWFYALVGNNQGTDPWIDEALATWAEARFDGTVGSYASRPVPPAVRGRVGEPMPFWDQRSSIYYVGAYVQGAQALAALGRPELVDCALRIFVARHAHRIATPRHFIDAAAAVFPDAEAVLARFGIRG